MKRIIYSVLFLSTSLVSCKKFLDKAPTDFVSPVNYFKTESDVMTALAGVYDPLGKSYTYGRTLNYEIDIADEGFNSQSSASFDLSLNNYSSADIKVGNLWTLLYQGVNRANMLLENIDNASVQMDEAKRKAVKGEALFLRGYYYFLLANNWGAVPLRLKPTASAVDVNVARTPIAAVYAQIVKDMEDAVPLVSPATAFAHAGRITKPTVCGILARVNLKMAGEPLNDHTRWAEAKKWAKVVIDDNLNRLNPDYSNIFILMAQDKYDVKESMWEIEFNKLATGGQEEEGYVGSITGIGNSDKAFGYSYGIVHVTERYYKTFATGDLRRDWTINNFSYQTVGGVPNSKVPYAATAIYNRCNAKFRREYETAVPKNLGTSTINFPILRYSDVLLMYAEAENEELGAPSATAYQYVNEVRKRAYGLLLPTPPNPTVSYQLEPDMDVVAFRNAIRKERTLELGFEGLRKFDLIRWGIFLTTMHDLSAEITATAPAAYKYASRAADNTGTRHLLLPIPSAEMSLNKGLDQNPEW